MKFLRRVFNIFNRGVITSEKLDDLFNIMNVLVFVSVLGGGFALLEIINVSNIFSNIIFPIIILGFSMVVYIFSKSRIAMIRSTFTYSFIIDKLENTRDEIAELIGVIADLTVERDQDQDTPIRKYNN